MQRYDEPGEKTRYFADDDGQDLESLVKRQRYEGAEDIDANLAENIARKATYKWVYEADMARIRGFRVRVCSLHASGASLQMATVHSAPAHLPSPAGNAGASFCQTLLFLQCPVTPGDSQRNSTRLCKLRHYQGPALTGAIECHAQGQRAGC